MEFSPFFRNDRIATKFYTWDGENLGYDSVKIGPKSKVKFIASWFSITTGTFGATLKPKLMQVSYREVEDIFDNFILDDDKEEVLSIGSDL